MRLLHTQTLELFETNRPSTLRYAILSHTWGDEEVSLQQFYNPEAKKLHGYKKIEQCCAIARACALEYLWVDTCCIDKTNNAELSEAINSMDTWYRKSARCYVYLSDYSVKGGDWEQWMRSRWFKRGWTLQELLASNHIEFYDQHWTLIGDPSTDPNLASRLSKATRIAPVYLEQRGSTIHQASVATRMSWAAGRQTTRVEDQAYSLIGLFDVNMPLLYGEGSKAFIRLQQEIARISDDESLFAWHDHVTQSGIFAPSALAFAGCEEYHPYPEPVILRPPYTITNRGLAINTAGTKIPWKSLHGHSRFKDRASCEYILLPLNCSRDGNPDRPFTIILRAVSPDVYVRWLPCEVMVHEKYMTSTSKNFLFERIEKIQRTRTVYIQDPKQHRYIHCNPYRNSVCTTFYKAVPSITPENWYITPPGSVHITPPGFAETNDVVGRIRFGGWTGFAVIVFRVSCHETLTIVLKHVFTQYVAEDRPSMITLEVIENQASRGLTIADVVNHCYAQKDLLNVVALNPIAEQRVDSQHGPIVLSRKSSSPLSGHILDLSLLPIT
ncbi:MAG: hypothetical protein LQ344_008054 [Seirophora lacunosa]|nr:MAG: hypothetical protein LQ344_008054 [Seirophora lacunosa]